MKDNNNKQQQKEPRENEGLPNAQNTGQDKKEKIHSEKMRYEFADEIYE
ncbi:hypothetical protein [Bacillus marinisedimentorum]|nr:hypothetical protein [Bacillus marinisedimentorum]